eukprot:1152746-Pelagomonas_calceolata.AAC.7
MEEDTCVSLHPNALLKTLVHVELCMGIFEMNAYKPYASGPVQCSEFLSGSTTLKPLSITYPVLSIKHQTATNMICYFSSPKGASTLRRRCKNGVFSGMKPTSKPQTRLAQGKLACHSSQHNKLRASVSHCSVDKELHFTVQVTSFHESVYRQARFVVRHLHEHAWGFT